MNIQKLSIYYKMYSGHCLHQKVNACNEISLVIMVIFHTLEMVIFCTLEMVIFHTLEIVIFRTLEMVIFHTLEMVIENSFSG